MLGKDLQKIFQKIQPSFAYEMLALEIDLELQTVSQQPKIQSITRLIQLYMAAVEALQSKCDKRYKYFNNRIQYLMKKKHVVEELHIASTGRVADKAALEDVFKAEIGERKNQLDLQIFLNKEQFDAKKVREMMKTADTKLKTFERNIEKNIKKQDEALQQRKRIRKMKSDAGSVTKIDFDRYFQSPNTKYVKKTQKQLDEYFRIDSSKVLNSNNNKNNNSKGKKRSGSIEKKETETSKLNANLLKGMVI